MRAPTLRDRVAARALSESYAHCQSAPVLHQIRQLSQADAVTWYAGHHCGFNKGFQSAIEMLWPCVQALELIAGSGVYDLCSQPAQTRLTELEEAIR